MATRDSIRAEVLLALATIAICAGLVALIPSLRHSFSLAIGGDFTELGTYARGLGAGGVALLLALMLAHAVLWYPTEIVTATAGLVYGFLGGLGLVVIGWTASALISYAIGRRLGRPLLRRLLGERFTRLERAMQAGDVQLLLAGRLIPIVPFSFLGYAAGATHIDVWRFTWTTVVGYLPLSVAVTYLGSQAEELSLEDPFVWGAAAVLLALLALTHRARRR